MDIKERETLLAERLPGLEVNFRFTHDKKFKSPHRGAKTYFRRRHHVVTVKYNGTTETYTYFCPVQHNCLNDRPTPEGLRSYKEHRLIGFLSCLVSEYTFLESEGIIDALDYMTYVFQKSKRAAKKSEDITDALDYMTATGCIPEESRETFTALVNQCKKLDRQFGAGTMNVLAEIVEDY